MNKQEAADQLKLSQIVIAEHTKRISELKAIIDAPDSDWFLPEHLQLYFFLADTGHARIFYHNTLKDKTVMDRQKVFRTEAEAQRVDDKRIAVTKYLKEIARLNNGWKPDWNDNNQRKYFTMHLHGRNTLITDFFYNAQHKDSDWYSVSESAAKESVSILSQEEIDLIFRS